MKEFKKFLKRTDVGLVQFFIYIGVLAYLLFKGYGWWSVVFVHLFFVLIYGIIYFRYEFIMFIISPMTAVIVPIQNYLVKKYLKNFKQNVPAEVVVILGRSDWFQLEAWIKPNFFKGEIKSLVEYLDAKKQNFSFYANASLDDIEKIMANKDVKEVYFFGHGDSHSFQLNTEDILYYCEFNNPEKYGKEFVHQIHCGTRHGKSLIDYVVPEKNRNKCFFFRKTINGYEIKEEFKKMTKKIVRG